LARFEQLNKNISSLLNTLIESQNLCKLLFYPSDDPLSEPDLSYNQRLELLNEYIFPMPKIPGEQMNETSLLSICLDNIKVSPENIGIKESVLAVEVIIHNNLWMLNNNSELRPYLILNEIDELLNSKNIVGFKKMTFERGRLIRYNADYSGYQVSYNVSSVN